MTGTATGRLDSVTARPLLAAFVLAALGFAPALAAAPAWNVDQARSTLTFVGTQQGEKFTGAIKSFRALVNFAPGELASSALDVTIDVKSIDSKSPDRDQALSTEAWFDYKRFPSATFKSVGALRAAADGASADADLTIKGKTVRIAFPFKWVQSGTGATLDARVSLNRFDFNLGTGEWTDTSVVGKEVEVIVHLVLSQAAAK